MADIGKPSDLSKPWAIVGDIVEPPDVKKDTGWTPGEIPARQYFNWLDNKQDTFIAHANQHGVVVWDEETEYQAYNSYVQAIGNGRTYICKKTHVNQDPNLDFSEVYWELAFAGINSPQLRGEPRATTALITDNSTRIATTEWTQQLVSTLISPALVRQPKNVTPADAAISVSATPTLTANSYYSLYGVAQASAQFQVSTVANFTSTVVNATVGAVNSYVVSTTLSGIHYWRVRYTDAEGIASDWSVPTQFTTAAIVVSTPSITSPANNATGVTSNPTITASAFAVSGGSDTHASTDWEIRTAPNGGGALQFSSYGNAVNKTTIDVPLLNSLSQSTVYYVRVRYSGTTYGKSGWTENTITTASQFYPTVIGQAYGGGFYAGRIGYNGKVFALIVAPKASGETTGTLNPDEPAPGDGSQMKPSASSYDGLANTVALAGQAGTTAAKWADALTIGGYTDWYLPARHELSAVYKALKPTTAGNFNETSNSNPTYQYVSNPYAVPPYANNAPVQTGLAAWQAGGAEAFTAGTLATGNGYWQSTKHISGSTNGTNFTSTQSVSFIDFKPNTLSNEFGPQRARAIRRVEIPAGF